MKHKITSLWPVTEDGFFSTATFERVFGGTMTRLNALLPVRGGRDLETRNDPLGRLYRAVRQYHHDGIRFARDWEAFRLGLLGIDLDSLQSSMPPVYESFRRRYRKVTFNEFFGWRHEVRVAAHLKQENIPFAKSEAPDFVVSLGHHDSYVECASVNVLHPTPLKQLTYKITSAIVRKGKKPYCDRDTPLCQYE